MYGFESDLTNRNELSEKNETITHRSDVLVALRAGRLPHSTNYPLKRAASPSDRRENQVLANAPDPLHSPSRPLIDEISGINPDDPRRVGIPKFVSFAWFVLIYNLAAVAWGVFVRASKSGDGGGTSWPLLDLSHQPMNGPISRLIEGSHRASTALCGVFAIILLVMAYRNFAKGHQARMFATVVFGLTCLEGLVGWALVRFGLVTLNDSVLRVSIMSFHVVSTFILVSAIALCAMSGMGAGRIQLRGQSAIGWMLGLGVLGLVSLGVSGAISALAHTLMPVKNVLVEAAKPDAFWMLKLQPLHPYLSLAVGTFFCILAGMLCHLRPSDAVRRASLVMLVAFAFQTMLGLVSIKLAAPIWTQMLHLVAGDVLFVSFVVAAGFALMDLTPRREEGVGSLPKASLREYVGAYIALTKPRVISLLLLTAGAAMFAAAKGFPGFIPLLAVMVGGYLSAGAANAMNMVIDRDIDAQMARTASRPTVTTLISTASAVNFSLILTFASFAILWAGANLWAAMIALAGQAFYVCIYTLLLKRRTWHNIVIGGAAGSVPPMVGWVATTGHLGAVAWWMFALIFLWTPVHFWALALLIKDDYTEAGVPMLPVEKGIPATVSQITFYMVLTVALSLLPFFVGGAGILFLIGAIALDLVLIRLNHELRKKAEKPQAGALFHYSMLYLALLFVVFAIDQRWMIGSL